MCCPYCYCRHFHWYFLLQQRFLIQAPEIVQLAVETGLGYKMKMIRMVLALNVIPGAQPAVSVITTVTKISIKF